MRHPKSSQLTVRGLDPRLQQAIRELARRERISLNKAALRLLEKGAGVERPADTDRIGDALDPWIGTWTATEAEAFLESIASCEQVDPELWD
jgi:hypothetical protein